MIDKGFKIVREIPWRGYRREIEVERDADNILRRQWILTNGLGGYASGTLVGANTYRYHGWLIAALPSPLGRTMMLNHLTELVRLPDGRTVLLSDVQHQGERAPESSIYLTEFRLEAGMPVWRYEVGDYVFEKRLVLPNLQNTAHIHFRLLSGDGKVRVKLRPSVHFRGHDDAVNQAFPETYTLSASDDRFELSQGDRFPPLKLHIYGKRSSFTFERKVVHDVWYREEEERGYECTGRIWSPGYFRSDLSVDHDVVLVASTEPWKSIFGLPPAEALEAERERRRYLLDCCPRSFQDGAAAELALAADQFIATPVGRVLEEVRAKARGGELRTVIAGYHWFGDWGRDTMIALEGLTLVTGRHREAGNILQTFSRYVRDGLIPNLFPEHAQEGLYHTADATLWFFHAIHRYLQWSEDPHFLRVVLPQLRSIVRYHVDGTRFGIHMDPKDALLCQGEEGYQLTWMDAKVGNWVVTPRRGKAVEINALWYNALRLMEQWAGEADSDQGDVAYGELADRARESFNHRFWNEEKGYLFDVVDGENGDDDACRPNQLIAISLDHPVLDSSKWQPVLETVQEKLLTPVGLRTLSPDHPEYKPVYFGNLRARDAAYHQGTVWPWLIGPYVDAWLRTHPGDRDEALRSVRGIVERLDGACLGSVSEVFDASEPYEPRGCISQAWSVAEPLRILAKLEQDTA